MKGKSRTTIAINQEGIFSFADRLTKCLRDQKYGEERQKNEVFHFLWEQWAPLTYSFKILLQTAIYPLELHKYFIGAKKFSKFQLRIQKEVQKETVSEQSLINVSLRMKFKLG